MKTSQLQWIVVGGAVVRDPASNTYPIWGTTNYPLLFDRNGWPKAGLQAVGTSANPPMVPEIES